MVELFTVICSECGSVCGYSWAEPEQETICPACALQYQLLAELFDPEFTGPLQRAGDLFILYCEWRNKFGDFQEMYFRFKRDIETAAKENNNY